MRKIALAFAAAAAVASTPALAAGTASGDVLVTLSVSSSCSVTAQPLDFGTVSSFATAVDATSSTTVKCTPGAPYEVFLDYGDNAAGGTQRKLNSASASASVNYNLYSNSARTTAWGGAVSGITGTGTGVDQAMTIYGQVPVQAAVAAATDYQDTVTVTVKY